MRTQNNIDSKKITIVSGKGGVGKSMLASSLAMLFSKQERVAVLDCDVDAPNLGIWLGGVKEWDKILPVVTSFKPIFDLKKCVKCGLCIENCRFGALKRIKDKPQLNPFLCEGCGVCEIVCPKKAIKLLPVQNGQIGIKKTKYGFPLIEGQLFPGETGSGKVVNEIKKEADLFIKAFFPPLDITDEKAGEKSRRKKNKTKDIIQIIDSAPGTGCPVIASLQDANFAVLITEPTPSGFSDLKRVLEVIRHFNIPWSLVINKWDINKALSEKMENWTDKRFLGKISYDKNIFRAVSNLTPILETKLKAKKEIENIYEDLKQKLKNGKI